MKTKFIELTKVSGKEVIVNVDEIQYLQRSTDNNTDIHFNSHPDGLVVKESLKYIADILIESKLEI